MAVHLSRVERFNISREAAWVTGNAKQGKGGAFSMCYSGLAGGSEKDIVRLRS